MKQTYASYQIFSGELSRYDIPPQCAGPVIYSYWQPGQYHGYIDIIRLLRDLDSGHIASKRGFGKVTLKRLRDHCFCEDDLPAAGIVE